MIPQLCFRGYLSEIYFSILYHKKRIIDLLVHVPKFIKVRRLIIVIV